MAKKKKIKIIMDIRPSPQGGLVEPETFWRMVVPREGGGHMPINEKHPELPGEYTSKSVALGALWDIKEKLYPQCIAVMDLPEWRWLKDKYNKENWWYTSIQFNSRDDIIRHLMKGY